MSYMTLQCNQNFCDVLNNFFGKDIDFHESFLSVNFVLPDVRLGTFLKLM